MEGTNGQVNARLLHALDRLHGEPRMIERRGYDRRRISMPWPPEQERRMMQRRAVERRAPR